jgi:glutathione S-transferase
MRVMATPKPTRQPEFLAINPRGKTPVFIDTDAEKTKVNESLAILFYLEIYYPDRKSLLPPLSERKNRARVLSLIQESENLHWIYDDLEDGHFAEQKGKASVTKEERDDLIAKVEEEMKFWETYASASGKFIAGDEFTLADCAFYPILAYMCHRGLELDVAHWPRLKAYYDRVSAMECARKALPQGWKAKGKENIFNGESR